VSVPAAVRERQTSQPRPAGTGKTAYIKKHLQTGLPERFTSMLMTFSAQTTANMTQVRLEQPRVARRWNCLAVPWGRVPQLVR
jgi:dynein heavy chain